MHAQENRGAIEPAWRPPRGARLTGQPDSAFSVHLLSDLFSAQSPQQALVSGRGTPAQRAGRRTNRALDGILLLWLAKAESAWLPIDDLVNNRPNIR
jgi:hypothetical protein